MRFTAGEKGGGEDLLAHACDHAALTELQAQAARLAAGGLDFRAIANALALPYPVARRSTLAAYRKLRRAHPHAVARQQRFLRDLFMCLRNVRPAASRREVIYAPLPYGGGFEAQPVTLRSRAEGEVVEDLLDCPLRFLRELPRTLAECAVRG